MSDENQPEYVWDFSAEKSKRGRVWVLLGSGVAAVAIAAVVFFLFLRPGAPAGPEVSVSPTPSTTHSPSPTASPSSTPEPTQSSTPAPTATVAPPVPSASPPPPADPDLPVFRGKVQPLIDDAWTGLSYAQDSAGQEGVQLVDQLIVDAGSLSDTPAPRSIAQEWSDRVSAYGAALEKLRASFEADTPTGAALSEARSAVDRLVDLIGG